MHDPEGVSGSAPENTPIVRPGPPGSDAGLASRPGPPLATRNRRFFNNGDARPASHHSGAILLVFFVVASILGFGIKPGPSHLQWGDESLLFPKESRAAIDEIDWSTILLVGGIVTYVGLLQRMGALERLGELASTIPWPLVAVFTLCSVGALISAFASSLPFCR